MQHNIHTIFNSLKIHARSQAYNIFCQRVFISLKNNYVFVALYKNAHSTILNTLLNIELGQKYDIEDTKESFFFIHENLPFLNPRHVISFEDFMNKNFTFCFVRNPYSRILSAYLDKIATNVWEFTAPINEALGKDQAEKISFEEFVTFICRQDFYFIDPHWSSQYYLSCQDTIIYYFIGKFETLEQDLNFVANKIGYILDSFYTNWSPHSSNATNLENDFFTQKLKKMVQKKFEYDFLAFNYPI